MKQAISKLGTLSAPAPQAKPPASAPHDHHCHFCGGEHWKSSCEVFKEYVRDGKCILRDDGRIADEPPHQIHSYTLLFSLFLHFPYITDPPLCTSTPT